MTVTLSDVRETRSTEKFLLGALIISLMVHIAAYSVWRIGMAQGWLRNLGMPRWMQLVTKAIMPGPAPVPKPKTPEQDLASRTILNFVPVDPALATPEPPKQPMFQGAKNTEAGNKEFKVASAMPNLEGKQQDFLKTTPNARPVPKAAAPAPPPSPDQVETQARPQNAPKQTYARGDTMIASPAANPQVGKGDSDASAQEAQPKPVHQRPRRLDELPTRTGNVGNPTQMVGGVGRLVPDNSLAVRGTPQGDYIQQLADAVEVHWDQLLKNVTPDVLGKVVLTFRVHPDGRITELRMLRNEVSDLLETTCEQAITDPQPFPKWSQELRQDVPNDFFDITFTFFYE